MKIKLKNVGEGCKLSETQLNLPKDYPWKVLSALHQDLGRYLEDSEMQLLSQIIRDRDIYALESLQDLWNLQFLSIDPTMQNSHVSVIRVKLCLAALLKKFRFDSDKNMREANAKEKFFKAEAACKAYNHSGFKALSCGETEHDAKVFTYAKCFLKKLLGDICPSKEIVTRWSRHGPGSNLDTYKGQNSIFFKYENWPYSCTKSAVRYARFLISTDKRWLGALEDSYRQRNNIPKHLILNRERFWTDVFKIVDHNRIAFVPKNAQTERTIAIEPSMNLMLQLGVDGHIRRRLKRYNIDLDSQEKNQILAYRGTIYQGDDEFVTLDLAMASDSLSLKLCEILLPADWYTYLCALRSPFGKLRNDTIQYEKISSMGNGYTFALESAIFASLIFGAIKAQSGTCDFSEFAVFGDDLIVKKRYASKVIRALKSAGFSLNLDKSFLQGYVKESCGTDWFKGYPVRPIYLETMPVSIMDLFVDINRLKRLLDLRFGIKDSNVEKLLVKWIPKKFKDYTGPYSDTQFESYLHVPLPKLGNDSVGWKFKFLMRKLKEKKKDKYVDFFFRKLMHNLGKRIEMPIYQQKDWKKRNTGGSRFVVYESFSYTMSESCSHTSNWCDHYSEALRPF